MPDTNRTYQLDDLHKWDFDGTALAVLGHPVSHSLSPAMHNAALQVMSQLQPAFAKWKYFRFEVPPEALEEALPLFAGKRFLGLNLTVPHKVEAVPLVDAIDPDARAMGAVNTLLNRGDKGWHGYNSDGFGLQTAIQRSFEVSLRDSDIILLGAGGAARAAAMQCLLCDCKTLWIGNRSQQRLDELLAILRPYDRANRVCAFTPPHPPDALPRGGIIVNATVLGLKADDPAPLCLDPIGPGWKIYDMTYGVRNQLSQQAEAHGLDYADGLSMLVWQGVRSLHIWSGQQPPAQAMMRAACLAKGVPIRHA